MFNNKRNGHDLVAAVHDHVEGFHQGLERLEAEASERRTVVRSRMADLEAEHHTLEAVLSKIDFHFGDGPEGS